MFQYIGISTAGFSNYNYWDIVLLHTKFQKFLTILLGFLECHEKSLFCSFCVFFYQNADQPHFMRQQRIALIFLPLIEHIKFYHLRYFSVLAHSKKTRESAKRKIVPKSEYLHRKMPENRWYFVILLSKRWLSWKITVIFGMGLRQLVER